AIHNKKAILPTYTIRNSLRPLVKTRLRPKKSQPFMMWKLQIGSIPPWLRILHRLGTWMIRTVLFSFYSAPFSLTTLRSLLEQRPMQTNPLADMC
ncbi:ORFx protein [Israeli acute paralysis virus]|uniref:ORFx protein n=1 Tax=Israeli acute paralysis virus TaxID=294365 RepID=UPI000264F49E|nr:ORFx protein [Israeli acute paralysis virus]